jgi:UDP-N-acetyl-2-amino-2-deoxyglucuronate dehydrogenase
MSVRFAVIGASGIGKTHLKELDKLASQGKARIVAVADNRENHAIAASELYHCDWHLDYKELLKREDVDVVNICTPSGLHAKMALEAAAAGKHLIVEKPMDIDVSKAEALIHMCREMGVMLSVVKQNRFAPQVRSVHRAIQQGLFGKPLLVNVSVNWYRSQAYYDLSDWRGTWAMDGGGAVMNQGIHTVDLMLHLMGDYESFSGSIATIGHERIEVEDAAVASIHFKSGALGVFTATTCAYPGFFVRLEYFGSEGTVMLQDNKIIKWETKKPSTPMGNEDEERTQLLSLHGLQFLDVIQAIKEKREPLVTGEEGIRSLRFISELYKMNGVGVAN